MASAAIAYRLETSTAASTRTISSASNGEFEDDTRKITSPTRTRKGRRKTITPTELPTLITARNARSNTLPGLLTESFGQLKLAREEHAQYTSVESLIHTSKQVDAENAMDIDIDPGLIQAQPTTAPRKTRRRARSLPPISRQEEDDGDADDELDTIISPVTSPQTRKPPEDALGLVSGIGLGIPLDAPLRRSGRRIATTSNSMVIDDESIETPIAPKPRKPVSLGTRKPTRKRSRGDGDSEDRDKKRTKRV